MREETLPEAMQKLTFNSDGPYRRHGDAEILRAQFLAEDVPVGLIPMGELGEAVGVPTPAINADRVTCLMTGDDFAKNARTLERMGLAGKDATASRKWSSRDLADRFGER